MQFFDVSKILMETERRAKNSFLILWNWNYADKLCLNICALRKTFPCSENSQKLPKCFRPIWTCKQRILIIFRATIFFVRDVD